MPSAASPQTTLLSSWLGSKPITAPLAANLSTRDDTEPGAPLFALSGGRPFTRDVMYRFFKRIGQRAGVDCYPHLFRHTFAITFLRNGGNFFVLQEFLGHSSLKMVRCYARIAEVDAAAAHRLTSPADNWNL